MQRIESGRLRGRRLLRLPRGVDGLRPTAARVRGAIFDRLQGAIEGARVLDLFGGSGAMSLEALSRGASHATIVELSGKVARHLQTQCDALDVRDQVTIVKADAVRFLDGDPQPFDVVIVDPPFAKPDIFNAIAAALVQGWLAPEAIVVCERELVRGTSRAIDWTSQLSLEATKNYGQAVVEYLRPTRTPTTMTETMTSTLAISARASAIKPSATLAVSAKAAALRAEGKQVLSFAAGEPDFKPPTAVRETVANASLSEPIRYAPVPGTPALRDAVAAELGAYHQREFARNQILVSCGAKHSLANLFLATLDPGDAVVVGAPYWVSYPAMVGLAGGVAITVKTTRAGGWKLTPDLLEPVLGPRTRFVVLNSPSNPTGVGYSASELRALGEVIVSKAPAAWIVTDDIYRNLVYDGFESTSAFVAMKGITDQIVAIDGVSKTYAMTGHRVGFMAGPSELISAAGRIQSQTTSGAATLSQKAALAALTDPSVPAEVDAMKQAFARRREVILDGLGRAPGVEVARPDGAFYVFADVSQHTGGKAKHATDIELATWLLEEEQVATVPGTPFGAPGHLRMSYATDDDTIEEGCRRIAKALASLPTA